MNEFRCKGCESLLAKEMIFEGSLEIKCPKADCRTVNMLQRDRGVDKSGRSSGRINKTTE